MVDLKRAGEHLQSAKLWIAHAQEAFDKEKSVRGELNLLLAQAELKRIREANRSCKWWYKFSFLYQVAACVLAVIMVTAGIGGAYWLMNRGSQPKTIPQGMVYHNISDNQAAKSEPKEVEKPIKSAAQSHLASSEVTLKPTVHQTISREDRGTAITAAHEDKAQEKALQDSVVSPDEMQKLVRSAGKSLRGQ